MTTDKTIDSSKVPQLIIQLPDGKEVHHPILGDEITVGRDPTNRICLSDNFVSKFHAKLLVSSHSITVVDLGSANKTRVNGKPIQQETVRFGDEIQFAGVKCRLVAPPSQRAKQAAAKPPAPAPPPPPHPPHTNVQPPAPPAPAMPKAPPVAPASKKKTVPVPGRAPAPPPTAASPMTRLYIIGGILIGIALVMGILLRVLLVPSGEPGETENQESAATTSALVSVPVTTTTAGGGTSSVAAIQPVGGAGGGDQSVEHYFDQALSYLDAGRLKEARTNFLKVMELDPQNSRTKTRLSLLEEEIETKAERHFDSARQAFNFLRYEEAIAEWELFMSLVDSSDNRYAEAEQGIAQARAKLR